MRVLPRQARRRGKGMCSRIFMGRDWLIVCVHVIRRLMPHAESATLQRLQSCTASCWLVQHSLYVASSHMQAWGGRCQGTPPHHLRSLYRCMATSGPTMMAYQPQAASGPHSRSNGLKAGCLLCTWQPQHGVCICYANARMRGERVLHGHGAYACCTSSTWRHAMRVPGARCACWAAHVHTPHAFAGMPHGQVAPYHMHMRVWHTRQSDGKPQTPANNSNQHTELLQEAPQHACIKVGAPLCTMCRWKSTGAVQYLHCSHE